MSKEIFSKEPQEYNELLAEALKKISEFEQPEWSFYVKTSSAKERPPENDDFWFKRAASILRQLYFKGVIGVNKLRTRYGAKKDRGGRPSKFRKASGKIIRVILQQAESAGFVEKVDHLQFGRKLTEKGRDFLDSVKVPEKKEREVVEVKKEKIEKVVKEEKEVVEKKVESKKDKSEEKVVEVKEKKVKKKLKEEKSEEKVGEENKGEENGK